MALKFKITGDNSNFLNSLKGAKNGVNKTARDIESTGKSLEDVFSNVGKAIGAAFTLGAAKEFVSKMYEVRSYFQDIESSMVVFLGSQEKAAKFTADLKDYAWYNMFEFSDLADASKQLIAYGNDVERISGKGGILDQLSNIATATKQPLMDLVDMWNKAKNTGQVTSEAMYQWANKGLVLKDVLTEMGETVRGNSVTFEQLQMAISKVTSEGGMFAGIMDEMMPNLSSSMGQLEDDLASMWNDLGLAMQEPMKKGIEFASLLVDNYQIIGESIAALIGVYGTYKASIIAINAAEKVHVMWTNAETVANRINSIATAGDATAKGTATAATVLLARAQASLNAIMLANPYVLVATAMASAVALLIMFKNELRDTAEITGDLNDALAELKDLDDESSSIKSLADEYDTLKSKAELSADETERLLRITEKLAKYLPSAIKVYDEYGNAIDINTESVREDIKARRDALNLTIEELLEESETKKQNILAQIEAQKKIYQQGIATEARQSVSSTSGYISTTYNERDATSEEKIAAAKKAQELYKELDELNVSIGEATKTLDGYYESLGQFTSSISGKSIDDLKAIQKAITDSINEGKKGIVTVGDFSYDFTGKSDEFMADALKAINNKLPMSGTSTTDTVGDKIAEANRKIKEMMSDNALDQEKMAKDRERAIAEATVRAMDEGYDKVIAERDRQNKEELDKIEDQKQEAIRKTIEAERKLYYEREKVKKINDPKYIIQDFDESTVDISQIEKDFDRLYSITLKKQENDQKMMIESLLDEYAGYNRKKEILDRDFFKKKEEIETHSSEMTRAQYEEVVASWRKQYDEALQELDQKYSDVYKQIFQDPSKMTKTGLENALSKARKELQRLIDTGASSDVIQPVYEQVVDLQNELENFDISNISNDLNGVISQLIKMRDLMKQMSEYDEGSDIYNQLLAQYERAESSFRKSAMVTGTSILASNLKNAASRMRELASAIGDVDLEDTAKVLEGISTTIEGAISGGMSSGSWIGALIGGLASLGDYLVQAGNQAVIATKEAELGLEQFQNRLELLKYKLRKEDFSTIFGEDSFGFAVDAISKYDKAIKEFESRSGALKDRKVKIERTEWFPDWNTIKETTTTYKKLQDYDIWGPDGALDIEKAKEWVQTNKDADKALKEEVQTVIDMSEAYKTARDAVDDYLSSITSSMGNDIADIVFDSVLNGADAWDVWQEKGSDAILSLGKQMISQLAVDTYLNQYTDELDAALRSGDKDELKGVIEKMYSGAGEVITALQDSAQKWIATSKDAGFTFEHTSEAVQQGSASHKGFAAMSQDSANELNGRFTALQIAGESVATSVESVYSQMVSMTTLQTTGNDFLKEIRDMLITGVSHLEDIAKYSKNMYNDFGETLAAIEKNTNNM